MHGHYGQEHTPQYKKAELILIYDFILLFHAF